MTRLAAAASTNNNAGTGEPPKASDQRAPGARHGTMLRFLRPGFGRGGWSGDDLADAQHTERRDVPAGTVSSSARSFARSVKERSARTPTTGRAAAQLMTVCWPLQGSHRTRSDPRRPRRERRGLLARLLHRHLRAARKLRRRPARSTHRPPPSRHRDRPRTAWRATSRSL
jgi:hypothetical protein